MLASLDCRVLIWGCFLCLALLVQVILGEVPAWSPLGSLCLMEGCAGCRNDIFGARDAGCFAWLWGLDVHSFDEVKRRLLHEEQNAPDANSLLSPLS